MSLRTISALATVFIIGIAAHPAHAETSSILSAQIGIGSQLSANTQHTISSAGFHAGISLNTSNTSTLFVLPGNQGFDLDYNYASGHGGHFNAYGLTYVNRISLVPKAAQSLSGHVVPYLGFGVGAFQNDVRRKTGSVTHASDKTTIGGKLIAGIDLAGGPFFEASYIVSGAAEGVRTDSLNFSVGQHF